MAKVTISECFLLDQELNYILIHTCY